MIQPPAGIALLPPIVQSNGFIFDAYSSSSSSPSTSNSMTKTAVVVNGPEQILLNDIKKVEDRKRQLTEQYLHIIEEVVDQFLSSPTVGVQLKAIPDRYLDEPPKSMIIIRRNADALSNCTQDAFNPHSELTTQVLAPLVYRVYTEYLDPLRQELYDFWMKKTQKFVEKNQKQANNTNSDNSDEDPVKRKLLTKCDGILQDINHIDQMRELDAHSTSEIAEKFKGQNGGLSHVVPIAGLALGRIHRLLNEHNTVIQHWGTRMQHPK